MQESRKLSPDKHMQRAGTHKVLGRGRSGLVLSQILLARVLMRRQAGADVNRSAASRALAVSSGAMSPGSGG
jgi:hypothetical protein